MYYWELIFSVVFTLVVFSALTFGHLEHGFEFLFPVPLAVFIIRHRVKDGIIPAIILIVLATLITHFLPLGEGSWLRGFLIMITAVTIAFLHGGLSKTKVGHFREILYVMGAEVTLGFIMLLVFYLVKDPVYAFNIEFDHYYHVFCELFKISETSIYGQNAAYIFQYMHIPFTVSLSMTNVLLTHILIHLVLKYAYEQTDERPFTGLNFTTWTFASITYLILLGVAIGSLFFLGMNLPELVLNLIVVIFIIVLGTMLIFIFQGVMLLIAINDIKFSREKSLLLFFLGLVFSVPFSILGAFDAIFLWSDKIIFHPKHQLKTKE